MNIKSKMATLLACALMLGACASNTSSDNTLASVDNDKKIIASDVYNDLMKSKSIYLILWCSSRCLLKQRIVTIRF